MIFVYAFLVGGVICALGQWLLDTFKLTPAQVICYFVMLGAAMDVFGWYDKVIEFGGAGAQLPITSFGHSVVHGAVETAMEQGWLGIAMGMFSLTTAGITSAILFAFLTAVIFKPKG